MRLAEDCVPTINTNKKPSWLADFTHFPKKEKEGQKIKELILGPTKVELGCIPRPVSSYTLSPQTTLKIHEYLWFMFMTR